MLRRFPLTSVLVGLALLSGCAKSKRFEDLPNQPPSVSITQAPSRVNDPAFYAYEMRWAGVDSDGLIDHFEYAIDPPGARDADTLWVATRENRKVFTFSASNVDSLGARSGTGYHTFVVRAVDNRNGRSIPAVRSFTSFTVAPTIQLVSPRPHPLLFPTFGPSVSLQWEGSDPDGRTTNLPVKYKYRLFANGNPEFDLTTALLRPDSLLRRYGPNFSEWDSVGGDVTRISLRDLVAGTSYLFAVIAFDEAGAVSPVFRYDQNMLYFYTSFSEALGPRMSVFSDFFFYQYPSGGYLLDPSTWVRTEVPGDQSVRIGWSGAPQTGSFVVGYRWALDIADLGDETPRTDQRTDLRHWSNLSPLGNFAVLPPFNPPPGRSELHYLYIEALDNNGLRSLAVVEINAIRPPFDRELLIVKDTRFPPDNDNFGGCVDYPLGPWPMAAELDTFLLARGNVPWRCQPPGSVSRPGVLAGYAADTMQTRAIPDGIVSMTVLGRYRHVIWMTDQKGSSYSNPPGYAQNPMTSLRWMSQPGRTLTLSTWVKQGGKLWIMGGGAATALQRDWDRAGTRGDVFSNADGELVPGRFMYDLACWRSEITVGAALQAKRPFAPQVAWPGMPDYSRLPALLQARSPATDPLPPGRFSAPEFYQSSFIGEAVTKPNVVTEDLDPDPDVVNEQSIVDTLYLSAGGTLGLDRPIMTLTHSSRIPPLVFSGFPLWHFRRQQVIEVVDWVLQDLWGLRREPVVR